MDLQSRLLPSPVHGSTRRFSGPDLSSFPFTSHACRVSRKGFPKSKKSTGLSNPLEMVKYILQCSSFRKKKEKNYNTMRFFPLSEPNKGRETEI